MLNRFWFKYIEWTNNWEIFYSHSERNL